MLDIKFCRENAGAVRHSLKKRHDAEKEKWFEDLLAKDEEWRKLNADAENLRARRNSVSREINEAKKAGDEKKAKTLLKEASEIPDKIKTVETQTLSLKEKISFYLTRLPNVLHESVPYGKTDEDNVEMKKWGNPHKPDFLLRNHEQIAEELGGADFERAAKISGRGFVFLKGKIALLEQALVRFAVDSLVKKGFEFVQPPLMLNREAYAAVTDMDDFEKVMYKIDGNDAFLIATSEHPLIAQYQNEVLEEHELPIKLAGLSPCFRREIGAHGVDTKGLFRMHQFNKVEQVILSTPEESWEWHEKLLENTEELWKKLEIPYRVVNICTGDIGIVAAKKYDVEAWFPREQRYREVCSLSNCTEYQSAGLNLKYRVGKQGAQDERKEWVHTLNATAIATSRALRAILENYQEKDGSVAVPKALRAYTGFDAITPEKK
ncbi:MAG TPA: serine--tRNA ligase [Candidatus Norongarragalinales archaeon]|nr:serine--tRNA ligase [Candidatus Norongarragalinales archaeon]